MCSNDGSGRPGKTGIPLSNACVRSITCTRGVSYASRTAVNLRRSICAEVVDRGACTIVHLAAAVGDGSGVGRPGVGHLVDGSLARFVLLAVVGLPGGRELRAQVGGGIGHGSGVAVPKPGYSQDSGQCGEQALHQGDATVAAASCPVTAP